MKTSLEKKKTIALLEKESRKTKEKVWGDLARTIKKPSRSLPSVNLWKLEKMAKKFRGKVLVVPGKVLSEGEIESKAIVAGYRFSEKAKEKLEKKGCTALSLRELIEKKTKPKEMVITE